MKKLLLSIVFLMSAVILQAQSKTTGVVNLLSGMTAELMLDNSTTTATLTLTGPSDRWFGLQFGSFVAGGGMQNGQDLVYYNGSTLIDAVHNGIGATPSTDTNNWSVTSSTVSGGTITIVATRAFNTGDSNDYTFVYNNTTIDFAYAKGSFASFTLSNHGSSNRGYKLNRTFTCTPPVMPTATAQSFCDGATVADLEATGLAGASFSWYVNATGGTALTNTTTLSSGTYYVSQTADMCESNRTSVAVTVNNPMAQTLTDVTACNSYALGVLAAGNNYYTGPGGTGSLLQAGDIITATQQLYIYTETGGSPNCTDESSFTITITTTPAPTADDQQLCDGSSVINLSAMTEVGATVNWYTTATGGTALNTSEVLVSGNYYIEQVVNGCSSTRTEVAVTITPLSNPIVEDQEFCEEVILAVIQVTTVGNDGFLMTSWYDVASGGTPLNINMTLTSSGTYYVSQTNGTCESGREEVVITINPAPDAPTGAGTQGFEEGETIADLDITTQAGATVTWYVMDENMQLVEVLTTTTLEDGEEYYVTQSLNGCESEPLAVTADANLGVNALYKNDITIYPNPVKEMLFVSGIGTLSKIVIVNTLGQEVINQEANSNEITIDTATLEAGTYFIQVHTAQGKRTDAKIIKQ